MPESVDTLLLTIISILIIIIFWGSVYAFFHAIFLFIFSAWDNEKIKKAWNSIRFMILWILLTLFFLFIFPLIFKRLNIENYEKYSASNIFRNTGAILSWLFSFWREAVYEYNNWWAQIFPWSIGGSNSGSAWSIWVWTVGGGVTWWSNWTLWWDYEQWDLLEL